MREKILNAIVCAIRNSVVGDTDVAINAVCVLSTHVIVCAANDCSVAIISARTLVTVATVNDVGKSVSINVKY